VREKNNLAIQYNSKVKKLAEEREKELKALTSTKNETGEQLFMRADSLYQQAYAKWQKNQEETEAWRMQFASMLSLFAGVSVVLSMILHVFVIIFYKKAEMTDEVVINHEDFEPQVWSEFKVWLKLKTVRGLRNKIRRAISGADNLTPFPYERLALLVNEKPAAGAPSTPQEVQPIKMEVGARELRELYEEIYQRLAGDLKEAHPTKAAPPPVEEEVKPPAPEEKPEKAAPPPVSTRRESSEHVTTIFVNGEAIIRHINSYGQVSEIGFDKVKKQIPVYRTRKSEKAQEINDLEGKLATLASDDPEREKLEKKLAAARASYQTNSENLEKFLAYRKILRPDEGD